MINDEDLELVIEDNTIAISDNVKAFKPKRKTALPEEATHEDVMSEGMEFFSEQVADGAKGFFAIVFDKEFQPQIVWTGEIELIPALGALELAKNEILNNIFMDIE
jgi:hypothetical protein